MKHQFAARVIGHELFAPNSDEPLKEEMHVKLELNTIGEPSKKPTRAVLTVPLDQAHRDFPLKRLLLISIEEGQLDLLEACAGRRVPKAKDPAQQGMALVPPADGEIPGGEGAGAGILQDAGLRAPRSPRAAARAGAAASSARAGRRDRSRRQRP